MCSVTFVSFNWWTNRISKNYLIVCMSFYSTHMYRNNAMYAYWKSAMLKKNFDHLCSKWMPTLSNIIRISTIHTHCNVEMLFGLSVNINFACICNWFHCPLKHVCNFVRLYIKWHNQEKIRWNQSEK